MVVASSTVMITTMTGISIAALEPFPEWTWALIASRAPCRLVSPGVNASVSPLARVIACLVKTGEKWAAMNPTTSLGARSLVV